jgi:hypothetical protein
LLAVTVTVFLSALSVQVATLAASAGHATTSIVAAPIHFFMKIPYRAAIGPIGRGSQGIGSWWERRQSSFRGIAKR